MNELTAIVCVQPTASPLPLKLAKTLRLYLVVESAFVCVECGHRVRFIDVKGKGMKLTKHFLTISALALLVASATGCHHTATTRSVHEPAGVVIHSEQHGVYPTPRYHHPPATRQGHGYNRGYYRGH